MDPFIITESDPTDSDSFSLTESDSFDPTESEYIEDTDTESHINDTDTNAETSTDTDTDTDALVNDGTDALANDLNALHKQNQFKNVRITEYSDSEPISIEVENFKLSIYIINPEKYPKNHSYCLEADTTTMSADVETDIINKFDYSQGPVENLVTSLVSFLQRHTQLKSNKVDNLLYEQFSLPEFVAKTNISHDICEAWGLTQNDYVIIGYNESSEVYVRYCKGDMLTSINARSIKGLPMFAMSLIVEDDYKLNFKTAYKALLKANPPNYSWLNVRIPGAKGEPCQLRKESPTRDFAIDFCLSRLSSTHMFCSICHRPVNLTEVAFKPFVCERELCFMQLTDFGFGTSLEFEIVNNHVELDLLLSLAIVSKTFPRLPNDMSASYIRNTIQSIPPLAEIKGKLENGTALKDLLSLNIIKVLRYVLAINRSFIKLCKPEERLKLRTNHKSSIDSYQHFHIKMSNPTKEALFKKEVAKVDADFKTLFAFHGSNVTNWFSILVNGLNFDKVSNGRVFGNGIYMALDFATALTYATSSKNKLIKWENSSLDIEKLMSLNEVVNKPGDFIQTQPYLVVDKPEWVQTRYLLVANTHWEEIQSAATDFIPQDPLFTASLDVPKPQEKKLMLCTSAQITPRDISDLIEPSFASAVATKSLFKNLRHMLKIGPDPLWTIDFENMESLYKWNVTLTGFDKDLPLSQDLKKLDLKGINLELYFGPEFPYMPPFVRVVSPRFTPFSQGGGGHITAGGSICMDLLTADGWLPSYSIEAVLLQVYLQISSIDPQPARLQIPKSSYQLQEAMDAFERVAKDHGWKINKNFRQFTL